MGTEKSYMLLLFYLGTTDSGTSQRRDNLDFSLKKTPRIVINVSLIGLIGNNTFQILFMYHILFKNKKETVPFPSQKCNTCQIISYNAVISVFRRGKLLKEYLMLTNYDNRHSAKMFIAYQ